MFFPPFGAPYLIVLTQLFFHDLHALYTQQQIMQVFVEQDFHCFADISFLWQASHV